MSVFYTGKLSVRFPFNLAYLSVRATFCRILLSFGFMIVQYSSSLVPQFCLLHLGWFYFSFNTNTLAYVTLLISILWSAAFLILLFNLVLSTISLAMVHERVPDRSYPPLPDTVLDNIPTTPWALDVSEILIMVSTNLTVVMVLLHKHRSVQQGFFLLEWEPGCQRPVVTYLKGFFSAPGNCVDGRIRNRIK